MRRSSPSPMVHKHTLSLEQLASRAPSSDGTTYRTQSECPRIVRTKFLESRTGLSANDVRYMEIPYSPRSNIEDSYLTVTTSADNQLISRHEPRTGYRVFVPYKGLGVIPLMLGVPDLDKQIRRACYCQISHHRLHSQ